MTKNDLGQTKSISSKCAELDSEIPGFLGVSKAILENVIFCHQEDSLWPLSEPAALKKKFDDIFASTRYTKVLDNLKSIKKEKDIQLKIDLNQTANLKDKKLKAAKVRKARERTMMMIGAAKGRIEKMDSEDMLAVQKAIEDVSSQKAAMNEIEGHIYVNRKSRENVWSNLTALSEGLEIYPGSNKKTLMLLKR